MVEFDPAPAITGTRPRACSTHHSTTCMCSSWDSVGLSPVVPTGTRPLVPSAICQSTRSRNAFSSREPFLNGVIERGKRSPKRCLGSHDTVLGRAVRRRVPIDIAYGGATKGPLQPKAALFRQISVQVPSLTSASGTRAVGSPGLGTSDLKPRHRSALVAALASASLLAFVNVARRGKHVLGPWPEDRRQEVGSLAFRGQEEVRLQARRQVEQVGGQGRARAAGKTGQRRQRRRCDGEPSHLADQNPARAGATA